MNTKGSMYEVLIGAVILIIIISFYATEFRNLVPIALFATGPVIILMGIVLKDQTITAVGFLLIGFAIVYINVAK